VLKKNLFFLLVILSVESILAVKDTLIVSSGDVLVGELKTMKRSVIQMETDYSDSDVMIDWDFMTEIYSDRFFI
jgi:hypothetical protein